MIHRRLWEIYNGDYMEWDPDSQWQLWAGQPGVYWPGPAGGFTGAQNWFGGPGVGGSAYAGRFGPLTAAQTAQTGSRYAMFYSVQTPATEGGDGTPNGWMTILEASSDGGSTTHGVTTPWGVARWAGRVIRLVCYLSTNMPVHARLIAWQSYGGGGSEFPGVLAGQEYEVQPVGWVPLEAVLTIPSVDEGTAGTDPYVGVGLDIRAGYAGTLGVTGWQVEEV